ncbi:hypothetical protein [Mesorhizobium sp. STM 4661]|uniref:hypothetical protein n=1 Tax=Mesorhizobium sp. STM 4661 TaxID=1297570 RepID=UPI0002BEE5BF|nr:hypothetical protein [Mesorhizobium sp. STM 4661]CCV12979.1 hypothetical protein MESS4_510146 [Mesorhizobium sp. STM 4661]
MSNFQLYAVEPQQDGTEDIFGPEVAAEMKLPFDYGWDHWSVYQGAHKVADFTDYQLAFNTVSALNATMLLAS